MPLTPLHLTAPWTAMQEPDLEAAALLQTSWPATQPSLYCVVRLLVDLTKLITTQTSEMTTNSPRLLLTTTLASQAHWLVCFKRNATASSFKIAAVHVRERDAVARTHSF